MAAKRTAVDAYFERATTWPVELRKLRSILLGCGLDESLKWGKPCYSLDGANVAILQPFKRHCALMFFQGALLEDTHGLLRSQGENTRSAMRLEFTDEAQIRKNVVGAYVKQAVAVRRSGREVGRSAEPELPEELQQALRGDRRLAQAFRALTPGRRRSHVIHIAGAKQSRTRAARVAASAPLILAGQGRDGR